MPYLPTAAAWLTQSSLLIQARPSTTKITTRYSHPKKKKKPSSSPDTTTTDSTTAPPKAPKPATLILKTYDPVSGTCLKYQTDRAAEVGRLVASLGRAGRIMAALPVSEDTVMGDAPAATTAAKEEATTTNAPVPEASGKPTPTAKETMGGGGGGGGKKKKGKRGK
ncbi:hypothetical protein FGG08_000301 [Glutinoglossum americanum]|uniref:SRP9 domain-containing protein n=1 Tax=Glutinoglossum americanum TaxID=1670608 RepID=A0A9P8L6Z3_9PEZI|nr:hypothetical protein FGG08_000301 [Glutinoglossum americanum]